MEAIQQTRPLKVLVTGGAGFIGSALVRQLIKGSPHTVLNLDKLTYAGTLTSVEPVSNSPRYQSVQGDICNSNLVADLFATFDSDPDVVCNLAAESHVDRSIDGPAAFIETNTVGTYTLLQAALKSSAPSATKDYTPKLRHTIPARRVQPPQLAQIILSEHGTILTVSRSSSPALWTTMKLISSPRS